MAGEDAFSPFDSLLAAADRTTSPWTKDGIYVPDFDLLQKLLTLPIIEGRAQESGRTAKAFDSWVAHELRRAGFEEDSVWPRMRRPRVLSQDLAKLEGVLENLATELAASEAANGGDRLKPPALRRAIRDATSALPGLSEAYILGDFYAKQIDVTISSWQRGPEVLVSTKTMFSSYKNNLKNRHEEAVGEVSSLRRRHPMAAMGFAFLVRKTIFDVDGAYGSLTDILRRLRRPAETFDATLLLVGDWDENDPDSTVTIDEPADDLAAHRFFADIVNPATTRTPITEHEEVRRRRDGEPLGGMPEDDLLEIPSED